MADGHAIDSSPPDPDDDSSDLRRDIADELADHLELAARSEMLKGKPEPAAQRAALARFGSPAAIARQLYLAAMKGKLMRQNIQTAAVVCMAVAVIVLGVMSWMALRAGQRAMAESMTLNNQAMLNAITAMNKPTPSDPAATTAPDPMQWSKLTVQLVDETGHPFDAYGKGFRVVLTGPAFTDSPANDTLDLRPNRTGTITTGYIRRAKYQVLVFTSGEQASSTREVVIWPGEAEKTVTIHCPTDASFNSVPAITLNWPAALADSGMSAVVEFQPAESDYFEKWRLFDQPVRHVEVTTENQQNPCRVLLRDDHGDLPGGGLFGAAVGDRYYLARPIIRDLLAGRYTITEIAFTLPGDGFRQVIWVYQPEVTYRERGLIQEQNKQIDGRITHPLTEVMMYNTETPSWKIELTPAQWDAVQQAYRQYPSDPSH